MNDEFEKPLGLTKRLRQISYELKDGWNWIPKESFLENIPSEEAFRLCTQWHIRNKIGVVEGGSMHVSVSPIDGLGVYRLWVLPGVQDEQRHKAVEKQRETVIIECLMESNWGSGLVMPKGYRFRWPQAELQFLGSYRFQGETLNTQFEVQYPRAQRIKMSVAGKSQTVFLEALPA